MTSFEKELALEFLSDLSDRFSNDGCNDYQLPITDEAIAFYKAAELDSYGESNVDQYVERAKFIGKNSVCVDNQCLIDYLINRIKNG